MQKHGQKLRRLELFLDCADLSLIRKFKEDPRVKGFTTNPTLMRASNILNYRNFAETASKYVYPLPISFEVLSDDFAEMQRQALALRSIAPNIYVKIPITNTKKESSLGLIKELQDDQVNVNITAVMTNEQVENIFTNLNFTSNTYISIFAGRISDTGVNPINLISKSILLGKKFKNLKILWASPRHLYNLIEAETCGCHVITMTAELWGKMHLIGKNLEEFSLETVKMFFNDAVSAKLFI